MPKLHTSTPGVSVSAITLLHIKTPQGLIFLLLTMCRGQSSSQPQKSKEETVNYFHFCFSHCLQWENWKSFSINEVFWLHHRTERYPEKANHSFFSDKEARLLLRVKSCLTATICLVTDITTCLQSPFSQIHNAKRVFPDLHNAFLEKLHYQVWINSFCLGRGWGWG